MIHAAILLLGVAVGAAIGRWWALAFALAVGAAGLLAAVDLLHLDDVGAENTTPWVLEELYSIVNTRYEEQRSMVITTNLTDPEQLREQIGPRTVSRLDEMCDDIPVFGPDRRAEFDAA